MQIVTTSRQKRRLLSALIRRNLAILVSVMFLLGGCSEHPAPVDTASPVAPASTAATPEFSPTPERKTIDDESAAEKKREEQMKYDEEVKGKGGDVPDPEDPHHQF